MCVYVCVCVKETEHADEIIDSLLTDGLLLSTLLHWRKLVDKHTVQRSHKQIIELQDKVEESEHKIIAAATSAKEASAAAQQHIHRIAEVEAEVTSIVATKKAGSSSQKVKTCHVMNYVPDVQELFGS